MKFIVKKLIRRIKFIIYFLIAFFGIILIIVAAVSSGSTVTYDILLGIGCGLVSSAMVTILLLVVLPSESEERIDLEEWGIKKIYEDRKEIIIDLNKKCPAEKLDIIAFGLSHFRSTNRNKSVISQKIKRGLDVRIITLNPNSEYVLEQEQYENDKSIKQEILKLCEWVDKINENVEPKEKKIKIKFYDDLPLDFYCRKDKSIYVGPYLPAFSGYRLITYEFSADSKGGEYYQNLFQSIWEKESNIKVMDGLGEYFCVYQSEGIEAIMKYFCAQIPKGINNSDVIGIIAVFKGGLRKTFFSCNKKHPEECNVHKKEEGTVGLLLKQIEKNQRSIIFSDYDNQIAYVRCSQERTTTIYRLEETAHKLDKDEETRAVLAIPIYHNEERKPIGALTFDFAELPVGYMQNIDFYRNQALGSKIDKHYEALEILFDVAEQCENIIKNFMGQGMQKDYKKLYEEKWKKGK